MNKTVIKNIISLLGIQGMNYIIPLITLPYLVRTLNPSGYGSLGFSFAFVQYFCLLVDYGFNLSATRKVAISSNDKNTISQFFWSVMSCKLLLFFGGTAILVIIINYIEKIKPVADVVFMSYLMVIGNILFPIWLFQGKEKMGWIAAANITSRLLAVPFIFVFVKHAEDAHIAAFITSLSSILAGLIALCFVGFNKWIKWVRPQWSNIRDEFKDGWHVFLSTAAISLYTTSTTVILGFIAGPIAVGYFVAADKLRQAVQGLISPISQAIYPRINATMSKDKNAGFLLIRKLMKFQGFFTLTLSITLFLLSSFLIKIIYGNNYSNSIDVLRILAWIPAVVGLNNVFGIQTLLVLGFKSVFSKILIAAGFFNVVIIVPLIYSYQEVGSAFAVLSTEVLVMLTMLIVILGKKIPLFGS